MSLHVGFIYNEYIKNITAWKLQSAISILNNNRQLSWSMSRHSSTNNLKENINIVTIIYTSAALCCILKHMYNLKKFF